MKVTLKCNQSNMDGEVVGYDAMLALSPVNNNHFDEDNFYPFDGTSNAIGDEVRRRRARKEAKQDEKLRLKGVRTDARANAKTTRANAKLGQAGASQAAAESLGKTDGDVAIANALAPTPVKKSGLSTGAKIGIAVGAVAVLGIVGYLIYKKSKK